MIALLRKYDLWIVSIISVIVYYFLAYDFDRTDFGLLVGFWTILFAGFYNVYTNSNHSFNTLATMSVLFRVVFIASIPNLSQDFYRFIWDGRMIVEGLNPYTSLPKNFIEQGIYPIHEAKELYAGMGTMNGGNYTNYPPINQLCFVIAGLLGGSSILSSAIVMRVILILSDIGIIIFGKKLLERIDLNPKTIFLYALNPFIITELTGNLHFEPVMLFFLVWSLYVLSKNQWIFSAVLLGCSVAVKLIPFLFLPLYLKYFSKNKFSIQAFKKPIAFYAVTILTIVVLYLPFLNENFLSSYSNSVGLWFRKFEFNASFYYIARAIGYQFRGYNEIATIGKIIPILVVLFTAYLSFFKKSGSLKELITLMLFALSFYYFTTTTLHPWYVATLVILSVFTNYRYPIIWSFAVILSYQAYANTPWQENLWFVGLEYAIVYGVLVWEIFRKKIVFFVQKISTRLH